MSDPDTLRAADAVRRANARLQRQLRALRGDHGVSASKLVILGRLHRAEGPMTGVEIAALERLQPQSLTRAIAELEQAGLVTRQPDTVDRRQVLIGITQAGRALLVEDARLQTAWLAAAMEAKLTVEEREMSGLGARILERLLF